MALKVSWFARMLEVKPLRNLVWPKKMVKGSNPDRSSHSRSRPGNDSTRGDGVAGPISTTGATQRLGVAHANWRHLRHTAPSVNGVPHPDPFSGYDIWDSGSNDGNSNGGMQR